MSDVSEEKVAYGMLTDHTGKRSASRATTLLSTFAFCAIAVGTAWLDWKEPSELMLTLLAGGMLGPIGFNRWLGEVKTKP